LNWGEDYNFGNGRWANWGGTKPLVLIGRDFWDFERANGFGGISGVSFLLSPSRAVYKNGRREYI